MHREYTTFVVDEHGAHVADPLLDPAKLKCRRCWALCCGITCALWGALAFVIAVLLPPTIDKGLDAGLWKTFDISDVNGDGYAQWQSTQSDLMPDIAFDVHAFNVTNPEEVARGLPVKLMELQPVRYIQVEDKINVSFNANKTLASYKLYRHFTPLDPDLQELEIYTPNLAVLGIVANAGPLAATLISEYYRGQTDAEILFVKKSIKDVVFGYKDPVLTKLNKAFPAIVPSPYLPGLQPNLTSPEDTDAQLGFNVQYTGVVDRSRMRQFQAWNSMQQLRCCSTGACGGPLTKGEAGTPTWNSSAANTVYGTYGTQAPFNNITMGGTTVIWVDTLFRHAQLVNLNNQQVTIQGIPSLRFRIPDYVMANTTTNPANWAYRMTGASGFFDISICEQNTPIFISKPRCLDCSPTPPGVIYLAGGPVRDLHDTWLDIDPITSTTMNAQKRLQVNTELPGKVGRHFEKTVQFQNMPIAWFDEHSTITPPLAQLYHSTVTAALQAKQLAWPAGLATGIVAWVIGMVCFAYLGIFHPARGPHERGCAGCLKALSGSAEPTPGDQHDVSLPQMEGGYSLNTGEDRRSEGRRGLLDNSFEPY